MALVEIKEGFHLRRMKTSGELFEAKKLSFAFYLLRSTKGEFLGRHLAKVVDELSEVVSEGHDKTA